VIASSESNLYHELHRPNLLLLKKRGDAVNVQKEERPVEESIVQSAS